MDGNTESQEERKGRIILVEPSLLISVRRVLLCLTDIKRKLMIAGSGKAIVFVGEFLHPFQIGKGDEIQQIPCVKDRDALLLGQFRRKLQIELGVGKALFPALREQDLSLTVTHVRVGQMGVGYVYDGKRRFHSNVQFCFNDAHGILL